MTVWAMGAYSAAFQLNLSIPDDIAIIGFDNQELIAARSLSAANDDCPTPL